MTLVTFSLMILGVVLGVAGTLVVLGRMSNRQSSQPPVMIRQAPPVMASTAPGEEFTLLLEDAEGNLQHEIHSHSITEAPKTYFYGGVTYHHRSSRKGRHFYGS